jgi:ribonuclease H / adenosylcobalamin/alpha-ribazole phosphatase
VSGSLGTVRYTQVPGARTGGAGSSGPGSAASESAGSGSAGSGSAGSGSAAGQQDVGSPGTPRAGRADQDAKPGRAATGWGPARDQVTTTLLLRHGQTALSAERRFAGRGAIPLTDLGKAQARAAAARLAARGGIDLIVSSPLARARRTAEAVAEATGVALVVEDDLAETDFGSWDGMTFAEVQAQWPAEMAAWLADAEVAPPGGESFAQVAGRTNAALDRLLAARRGETLVVVSHVTPIKTLVCRAVLAPPAAMFRIHLDVASLCEIDWFADGPALLRSFNDTSHLAADAGQTNGGAVLAGR